MSPSNGSNSGGGRGGGVGASGRNYIEHQVCKMDTLAGVAIKYGVEVADIKRLNGLATDLQMFALKTLQIPLPGRHPPSPCLSDASSSSGENLKEKTPPRLGYSNMLESFESLGVKSSQHKVSHATRSLQKISPAMSTLQNYYGLKSPNDKGAAEGMEMEVYRTGSSDYFDYGLLSEALPMSDLFSNCHQKPVSLSNGFLHENGSTSDFVPQAEAREGEGERSSEKSVRRRQKAEAESRLGTPERLLKEENGSGSNFSPLMGKGLAMRPKSTSRTSLTTDSESGWLNSIPVGIGDSIITDGLVGVRKSSSTPSFQDQDSTSSSVWPTSKWSLKPDLQALSTTAIARPIFDGLPKPMSGRRSKAALD